MKEILITLNNIALRNDINGQERELTLLSKVYLDKQEKFWDLYKNNNTDGETLKLLGKELNNLSASLDKFFINYYNTNEVTPRKESLRNNIFLFATQMLLKYNDLPPNLNALFLKQTLRESPAMCEELFNVSVYNYNLFYDIYKQYGYEGIAKFLLIDKNLITTVNKGMFEMVKEGNSITREKILNLSSPNSIMQHLSFENQALVITTAYFDKQPLDEKFINIKFPNFSDENSKKKIYFL